jgi:hypothetical protein
VVSPDLKLESCPFQEVSPFLQCTDNYEHLLVMDLVIPFNRIEAFFERKATGCHFLSVVDCWDRTTPVAKSELSASMRKGHASLANISTGWEVIACFNISS